MTERGKTLQFACECVSSGEEGYTDPWSAVARHRLLPDGTKEEIVNLLADGPKTISQLAQSLGLSAPSVHAHVSDMVRSELLREAVGREKAHQAERYYEPNFPVLSPEDGAAFDALCGEISERVADLFARRLPALRRAFGHTGLGRQGWGPEDIAQYWYARVQREARRRLEERGLIPPGVERRNGLNWVFWAEQPNDPDE